MKRQKSVSDWLTQLDPSTTSTTSTKRSSKRKCVPTSSKKKPSGNVTGGDYEAWSAKYAPTNINELAVHKKKITEVQQWLERALSQKLTRPVLLLTGPAGCGKTATIHALSHEMSLTILEWSNPIDTLPVGLSDKETQTYDNEFYESQVKKFTSYLRRANKYPSLSLLSSNESGVNRKSKIVLIEDIPNAILRDPTILHNILKSMKSFEYPLVFIVSDNQSSTCTASRLFPSHLISSLGISSISFNPIAHTNMVKALQRIVDCESGRGNSNGRGSRGFPNKEIIEAIAGSNIGDIRSAVNSLQFVCLRGAVNEGSTRGRRKVGGAKDNGGKTLEQVMVGGDRDSQMFLFRALGKIFYCKRSDEATPNQLPLHLLSHERSKLLIEPEIVYNSVNVSSNLFSLYLHQNYLDFHEDIVDASTAIEYMSSSDVMSSVWAESYIERSVMEECSLSLCCRGVMFANAHTVASRWRPFHKPLWNTVNKQFTDNCKSARDLFLHLGLSEYSHLWTPVELLTQILPFISLINKPLKNVDQASLLFTITNFRTSKRRCVRLGETEMDDIEHGHTQLNIQQSKIFDAGHVNCDDDVTVATLSQLSGTSPQDEANDIEQFDDDDNW